MENKKKKRFRLFDITRDGKGISKSRAAMQPGLKRFFITFKENFNKLVTVNIIFVLGNFPVIFIIAALSGATKADMFIPLQDSFQNVNGLVSASGEVSPYMMTVYSLEGLQSNDLSNTLLTYIFYGIGALSIFTFGPINAGTAYVLRNIVSGEPVFVWADFKYALKRNWKQALPFGIIDVAISALLAWNIYTMFSAENFLVSLFFWTSVIIIILYFFMRYYMYVQMVTFDLTVFKMMKNSLIFTLVGFKRNIVALLGILLGIGLEILFIVGLGGVLIPFAIAAPLALFFALFAYIKVYASYFKIKELMIDPYYAEHPELRPEVSDEEAIMHDDVTELERLEEVKRRNGIN
ncbi:MAG: YesL family protein [Clostridia bacterium]|nr:YesL family protein [Clostridia bacterium]